MRVDPGDWLLRSGVALASALSRYHRHQVVHLERLETLFREGRRVILVGNHALDVVDPLLLLATVYRKTGRVPRFVGHEKGWFRLPLVRDFSKHFEVIPSRRFGDTVTALRRDARIRDAELP
jgi:1-acyl-sn-glycerol-3-phosphate acyltransferase